MNGNFYKLIVQKFCKQPVSWGREMKLCKEIATLYPFLDEVELDFKLNSLAWFKTPKGKAVLQEFERKKLREADQYKVKETIHSTEHEEYYG